MEPNLNLHRNWKVGEQLVNWIRAHKPQLKASKAQRLEDSRTNTILEQLACPLNYPEPQRSQMIQGQENLRRMMQQAKQEGWF